MPLQLGDWQCNVNGIAETLRISNVAAGCCLRSVVDIGNCTGERIDKFKKFGLTGFPPSK